MKRSVGWLFLGCVLIMIGGCARQPADAARESAAGHSAPAPGATPQKASPRAERRGTADTLRQPATPTRPVARIFVMPAGERAPVEPRPPEKRPEPTAKYASLEDARDSIGAILSRVVSGADTAIHVGRPAAVTFNHWYAGGATIGWAFTITVTDTSTCPDMAVERALTAAGWVEHLGYMADGPDGSTVGFVSRNHFCLVEGRWDGGDDSDSTYVPLPGCQVTVTCVRRRDDDVPPP